MQSNQRPYALTIAGLDPSSGAGLTADTKTMEQLDVYCLNVCSALTVQNDDTFLGIKWQSLDLIIRQLDLLLHKFMPKIVKISLIQDWKILQELVKHIVQQDKTIKIVLDPIFRASAGFDFHSKTSLDDLEDFLEDIYLITPNLVELKMMARTYTETEVIGRITTKCHLLLKGGHSKTKKGVDFLYCNDKVSELRPHKLAQYEKHGSGCVLSAAIVAYLAKGDDLLSACQKAKIYMTNFLDSNPSLLGYH